MTLRRFQEGGGRKVENSFSTQIQPLTLPPLSPQVLRFPSAAPHASRRSPPPRRSSFFSTPTTARR